jgi:exodeoxyribonuclease-3
MHHPEAGIYSWWDYRQLAFQKRKGLRIDLVLATDILAAKCTECVVDKDARRGKGTSDHAPVVADFDV